MRVVGGFLAGRTLTAPRGLQTRPTADRVREAVFNILVHHDWKLPRDSVEGAAVLDAFCGSGALALEAVSRGAASAWLWDRDPEACKVAQANVCALGLEAVCHVRRQDALHPPKATTPCSLIFLDPPYRKNLVPQALSALAGAGWIASDALIVAETAKTENLEMPPDYYVVMARYYGDTAVHFVRVYS